MYENPTVDSFKEFFYRDFPFNDSDPEDLSKVLDRDIQRGINEAALVINEGLCSSQADYTNKFLYLSAHNLVMNLRASSQGISGQASWLQTSKSVGSVSEASAIPSRILENPAFAALTKTNYGAKYLDLILPMLSGFVFNVEGATNV